MCGLNVLDNQNIFPVSGWILVINSSFIALILFASSASNLYGKLNIPTPASANCASFSPTKTLRTRDLAPSHPMSMSPANVSNFSRIQIVHQQLTPYFLPIFKFNLHLPSVFHLPHTNEFLPILHIDPLTT